MICKGYVSSYLHVFLISSKNKKQHMIIETVSATTVEYKMKCFLWVNPYIWIHVQLFYQDCDWKALQPDWFINHQWQQQQKLSHVNIVK